MIDLRNIETFFWVSTLGSFRAAAEKLNTTQPTVSQRIALLESGLSVRLFERGARGVTPTAKGQELHAYAERMLQIRREMVQVASEQQVMSGTVRIGVAETIVQTWLPSLIEQIHATYPALVIEIEVDTSLVLRNHLLSRQINLANRTNFRSSKLRRFPSLPIRLPAALIWWFVKCWRVPVSLRRGCTAVLRFP